MKRLTSGNKWNKLFKQEVKDDESDQEEEETKTEQDDLDNHHDEEITTKVAREDISGQSVWNYVRKDTLLTLILLNSQNLTFTPLLAMSPGR